MILKLVKRTSRSFNFLQVACRNLNSKIPKSPVPTLANEHTSPVKVERNTIALLERLSLVSYDTDEGVKILEDSINFANKILHVNTDDVEPLYSVLEDQNLILREDKITQGNCQKEILKHAAVKEDDYFVAPIGNIPLHEVEAEQEITKQAQTPTVFGVIQQELQNYDKNAELEVQLGDFSPLKKSLLQFNLIIPKQDAMQYFIQWQRYRKYWWSSISTTPSLFSVNEFKQENNSANVYIVAHMPSGQQRVENICFKADLNEGTSRLTCSMCLEDALFILLMDGLNNSTADYLRLHRKIAPFKISFAVDLQKQIANGPFLCKLATLLYHKLESKKISAWLPNFSLPFDMQIKENLKMGVTYTGILEDETLKFGIFKLMNSSTKLMEQVHVADFCKNAAVIFESNK